MMTQFGLCSRYFWQYHDFESTCYGTSSLRNPMNHRRFIEREKNMYFSSYTPETFGQSKSVTYHCSMFFVFAIVPPHLIIWHSRQFSHSYGAERKW